jgi:xylan 1,4-beta-xylosidase
MRLSSSLLLLLAACATARVAPPSTFANPLDLDYRFMPDTGSWRQAADPLIVVHDGEYFLFASRSGGYWHSPDMRQWTLVEPTGLPIEDYAPAVVTIDGRLYYTAHKTKAVFTTDDPTAGAWRKVADIDAYADPAFFLDDDGRLYLYYGSGLNGAISAVELDPRSGFRVIGGPFTLIQANYADHGWERSGADNLGATMAEGFRIGPYVEGSWMTKHDGRYYLQYAAPGTVWFSYADGVYTSRSPTSGFTYEPYSPFSYKPGGFIGSAGHSGLFRDKAGNYWRITTMVISVKHKFERRLGLFPAGFDADGVLRTDTYLGDYPQLLPGIARSPLDSNRTGWMLLSRGQPAAASSSLPDHPPQLAFDEDVRTHWSARTGSDQEWLSVELDSGSRIRAVQINFAEQDTKARDRAGATPARYVVESSNDRERWTTLIDRRATTRDAPHAYVELPQPVSARHVRIRNAAAAAGGRFAIRDLRVFGESSLAVPDAVRGVTVRRHDDERSATVDWARSARARSYVVRFGIAPGKLYSSHQVGDVTTLTMNSLNRGVTYYFAVDAVNEGGVTAGAVVEQQ